MDDLAFDDAEIIVRQQGEVGQLPRLDLALLADLVREPCVLLGPEAQRGFAVKAVADGKVSPYLVHQTQPGTLLHLEQAAGDFVLPAKPGPLLFVTAGSGVTPVIGMLRNLFPVTDDGDVVVPDHARGLDITVIHVAPSEPDSIFLANLRALDAAGAITDNGTLDVSSIASFSGSSIALGSAGESTNFGFLQFTSAGNVSIQEDSGITLAAGTTSSAATLTLDVNGPIDDGTGTLNVGGLATLTAAGANVVLDNGHVLGTVAASGVNVFLTTSGADTDGIILGDITTSAAGNRRRRPWRS